MLLMTIRDSAAELSNLIPLSPLILSYREFHFNNFVSKWTKIFPLFRVIRKLIRVFKDAGNGITRGFCTLVAILYLFHWQTKSMNEVKKYPSRFRIEGGKNLFSFFTSIPHNREFWVKGD